MDGGYVILGTIYNSVTSLSDFYLIKLDSSGIVTNMHSIKNSQQKNISIFPNPVTDNLYLSLNLTESADITVNILNSTGQVVLTQNCRFENRNNRFSLNTDGLSKGIYFIHVKYKEQNFMEKFIK